MPKLVPAVAVVVSRYNGSITEILRDGALRAYAGRGGGTKPDVYEVPGVYELPVAVAAAVESGRYAGVVALGCVIKGETRHDRYIAQAAADGLMAIAVGSGVPVSFGVLTVESPKQARARAGGAKGNKGEEAMLALLETIETVGAIAAGRVRKSSTATKIALPDKAARARA